MFDDIIFIMISAYGLWGVYSRPTEWAWLSRMLGAIFFALLLIVILLKEAN